MQKREQDEQLVEKGNKSTKTIILKNGPSKQATPKFLMTI
jgi:hypothetical protein